MNIREKLLQVQTELKAPKGQYNKFGNYNYRSAEDILEALKPLLKNYKCLLVLTDEVQIIGERYYIKATATIIDTEDKDLSSVTNSAYARESADKKGMDDSQISGTASSYARKYALNGLFLIDDTKDADTDEYHEQTQQPATKKPAAKKPTTTATQMISEAQVKMIKGKLPQERIDKLLNYYKVFALEELTKADASKVIEQIMKESEGK